ncbi:MAG: hypothetical protein BGO29_00450 [Bacteroidales bacterium 36-12]|mgnify:CR=1 FL=1|nr:MAG: hypothetical protein BGO29_00450 [Bacteroidales bacterium 36-12]
MKKINFILVLIFAVGNLFATGTWDLMDKVMDPWNEDEGLPTNKAWTSYIGNNLKKVPTGYSLTQEEGFVNLTKTHAEATQNSAMINCAALTVASNTAYTFEYKVRINPIDKEAFPDVAGTGGWELNLLSARINNRAPNLYLAYDESNNGYVTLESTFPNEVENRVAVDISEWRVYRFILSEDATKFDLFIDGELIFKDAPTTAMSGTNILRMGSASERARCDIDLEYAKMGTGDFNTVVAPSQWNILDKSMLTWNQDDGSDTNRAWALAQGGSAASVMTLGDNFVNFTKTNTGASARWAWLRPATALANLIEDQSYSLEVKARVNEIDKTTFPDGTYFEANQIALRFANTATTPIYLRYGDAETGSISTISNGSNAYNINTSEWQVYRIVLHADLKYDVYIDGIEEPIFEGQKGGTNGDQNGVYFGAESQHRCNLDIEYAKLGIGDFFSKPRITTVALSHNSHVIGNSSTITVTANTSLIDNNEILLFSLVDENDTEIVAAVEATVTDNVATANIEIPEDTPSGQYFVKVAVPDNQIGDVNVAAKTIAYEIEIDTTVGIYSVDYTDLISVSRNVVSQGQTLSVKTVANIASLSEVTIYSLTGNEVYHKSVSGNALELQAPTVSGMYILNVRLDNNISKGFKIFVE